MMVAKSLGQYVNLIIYLIFNRGTNIQQAAHRLQEHATFYKQITRIHLCKHNKKRLYI